MTPKRTTFILVSIAIAIWLLAHIPGVFYGTYDVPLHQSYIGDEQSAVNGALHMLQEKSILGFRNIHTLYYGPIFVMIDTPAVVIDFASKWMHGLIHSAGDYQNYILYDWGGIVFWLHITAVLASLLGLYAIWLLLATRTMNPAGRRWLPYLGTALVAVNFYFFEYSHFAKHWAFIIPLAIVQFYCLVRIHETDGEGHKYWIIHAIATVLIFGISYGGVIFLVMWVPWLAIILKDKNWPLLKKFLLYAVVITLGSALMVAWDPYPFIRNISLVGIGAPKVGGIGTGQNPFVLGQNSLGWYAAEIVVNNLALAAGFLLLLAVLWKKKIGKSFALWTLVLPALIGYLFFGLAAHHEGRYMLPTIVFLILAFGYLLSEYVAGAASTKDTTPRQEEVFSSTGAKATEKKELPPDGNGYRPDWYAASPRDFLRTTIITLIACYAVFQMTVDIEWMNVYARGPIEKQGIAEILQLQKTGAPVLIIQGYILGAIHDKASYEAYLEKRGRTDLNLYVAIMAGTPPPNIPELDVRYASEAQFAADPALIKAYSHAVWDYIPIPDQINQFDIFDRDVMGLWYYDDLSPRYVVLK